MSKTSPFIMISSGGTGGHMSPASALATELRQRGVRVELMTDSRGLRYSKMFDGLAIHEVRSGTAGAGLLGKVKGALNLGRGILSAFKILKTLKPDIVVGFGGYPSVPGVFAAQRLKIPTVLHEQNAIIGKANVFLAPKAKEIALSLPYVTGLETAEQKRVTVTGNPVRADIVALSEVAYAPLDENGPMNIFIMGGSLGATVLSEVVPRALSKLSDDYRKRLNVVQQCREADIDDARQVYEQSGITAELSPFIDDVADVLQKAHLVIARSGASTVAEVSIAGKPVIYVPYPHHKDQQQKRNADAVADEGGAWVMTEDGFTVDALFARIETFFQNSDILPNAAARAKTCGKPDAASALADIVVDAI
ncbi:MAG: undecaprenyldiphospho-muramoylpentapeptide beta-N-acetylglucosaminyltransferase [Alphaproteobacteria bacterium]